MDPRTRFELGRCGGGSMVNRTSQVPSQTRVALSVEAVRSIYPAPGKTTPRLYFCYICRGDRSAEAIWGSNGFRVWLGSSTENSNGISPGLKKDKGRDLPPFGLEVAAPEDRYRAESPDLQKPDGVFAILLSATRKCRRDRI